MRDARLTVAAAGVALAALVGPAAARTAGSDKPVIHDAWIDGDDAILRVRLAGSAAPEAANLTVTAGETRIVTDQLAIKACSRQARVAVLVAYGPGAPSGPAGGGPDDAPDDPDGADPDVRAVATAIETALRNLDPLVSLVAIDGSNVELPEPQPLRIALARLGPRVGHATPAGLDVAFKGVEEKLDGERTPRRLVLLIAVGRVDTGGLDRAASQLVDHGVELYEIRLGSAGQPSADPLSAYGAVAPPGSAREQGDSVGAEIDRCHRVTLPVRALPVGEIKLAVGLHRDPPARAHRSLLVPAPSSGSRGTPRWIWILIGVGAVVVVVIVVVLIGSRAPRAAGGGGTLIYTPMLDGGDDPEEAGVAIGVKTRGLGGGQVGKTRPIDPVAAQRIKGTVAQKPAAGLAAWLVVYRHGVPTDTLVLQTVGVTTIGREPDVSIRLDDDTVSKRHARITARGGRFQLEDLDSTHGTVVDGKPITGPVQLDDGMRIGFGYTRVVFKCTR